KSDQVRVEPKISDSLGSYISYTDRTTLEGPLHGTLIFYWIIFRFDFRRIDGRMPIITSFRRLASIASTF
ncbi:unnamed protein product, partial [Ceratitis capitata]